MIIEIKYNTLGADTGLNFIITCDVGNAVPQIVTKAQLLAGVQVTVNNAANEITVVSQGKCESFDILYITSTTTTTTTSTSTSTTTSTTSTTSTSTTSTTTTMLFWNNEKSGSFQRNNCPIGETGSWVTYTVPAGTYSSTVSQAYADLQAQQDVNMNGQAYANTNGTCDVVPVTTTTTTTTTSTSTTTTSTTTTSTSTTTSTTTTSTTSTSTTTSTTTTTTTYIPDCVLGGTANAVYTIACGATQFFDGGQNYPTLRNVTLGSGTGSSTLQYYPQDIPDRFIVIFDGAVVIDTGYGGDSATYGYGGASRSTFNASLNGKVDPITLKVYPDITIPDTAADGYPVIHSVPLGGASTSFSKLTATTTATVLVYGPVGGTNWSYRLNCVV